MSIVASGTSGSTPVGYHDLPWPSAASGTPGLLEPASASITGRSPVADFRQKGILVRILLPTRSIPAVPILLEKHCSRPQRWQLLSPGHGVKRRPDLLDAPITIMPICIDSAAPATQDGVFKMSTVLQHSDFMKFLIFT